MSNVCAIAFRELTPVLSRILPSPCRPALWQARLAISVPSSAIILSLRRNSTERHNENRTAFLQGPLQHLRQQQNSLPKTCLAKGIGHRNLHTSAACLARRQPAPQPRRASYAGQRVPIPFGNVGKEKLDEIFGHDMLYEDGNKMLQILHSRRVTGALIDQGIQIKGTHGVPDDSLRKALEWLRQKYPVDEQAAAEDWAQNEAAKLEKSYIARAERLGLYKPIEEETTPELSTKSVYGTDSVIDDFKRHHEERRKKEQEERVKSGEEQKSQELRMAKRVEIEQKEELRMKAREERREQRQLQGMISQGQDAPPELTLLQRLFPSTAVGITLIFIISTLGYTYTPPPQSLRLLPETPVAVATILYGILLPNLIIYGLWKVPRMWRLLNMYFVQTPAMPYSMGVLGNIYSHVKFSHFLTNMAAVLLFGTELHEDIGRGNFVALYLTGGIVGSLSSLWSHALMKRFQYYTFGASGAVWAVMTAWAYFTIDKPTPSAEGHGYALRVIQWAILGAQVLSHLAPGVFHHVDVASHLGGAAVGLLGAWLLKRWTGKAKEHSIEDIQEGYGR